MTFIANAVSMIRGNLLEIPTSDELQSSKKVIPQSEYCFRKKKIDLQRCVKTLEDVRK